MKNIYNNILVSIEKKVKSLAVLIDPDKMKLEDLSSFMLKVNGSIATHVFVGGSIVDEAVTDLLVIEIKNLTSLPVVLFPGDIIQNYR